MVRKVFAIFIGCALLRETGLAIAVSTLGVANAFLVTASFQCPRHSAPNNAWRNLAFARAA
jgi:hypothetical protein